MADRPCTECRGSGAIEHEPSYYPDGQICDPPFAERCDDCIGVGTREAQLAVGATFAIRELVALCDDENAPDWSPTWDRARALVDSWGGES